MLNCPSLFVTFNSAGPNAPGFGGRVAVISVVDLRTTLVAAAPATLTVAPGAKFAPVMVNSMPPVVGPFGGAILAIAGVGSIVMSGTPPSPPAGPPKRTVAAT